MKARPTLNRVARPNLLGRDSGPQDGTCSLRRTGFSSRREGARIAHENPKRSEGALLGKRSHNGCRVPEGRRETLHPHATFCCASHTRTRSYRYSSGTKFCSVIGGRTYFDLPIDGSATGLGVRSL